MSVPFKSRQELNPDSWSISYFKQTPSIRVKMENIDEELKINICNILPSISKETVDGIIHALKYVGLETMSDLQFVQEEDLILVLQPIQRRKLVNAWCKQNTSNSQTDEIKKNDDEYVLSNLRYEDWSTQSVSTAPSETETLGSLSKQNCKWNKRSIFKLLELYTKYKTEFSHPDIEEQIVWKKIAYKLQNCDELECRNKIDELRYEYERLRNKDVTSRETAIFLDEAKKAFEMTKTTGKTNPFFLLNLKKRNKDFLSKLLQVYAKYKTELASPDIEEEEVWKKIAEEMRKFSYACGETLCRFELLNLKCQYENLKRDGVKNENMVFLFQDAKEAFESSKNLGIPPVKSNILPSENCKWNRKKCLVLLQVYPKYKTELSCSSIEEKYEIWRKIAEEVRQKCSLKCNELQCMDKIKELKSQYYILKYNNKNELNQSMTAFFSELTNAFDNSKNPDTSSVGASQNLSANSIKDMKRDIRLLRRFAKYKLELSHPDVEEQTVWKKIAGKFDESQCHNKLDELRHEYERIRNEKVSDRIIAIFLDEAKRAFETTEITEQTSGKFSISFKKGNKDFLRKLLQMYTKYKTELKSQDMEEQDFWEKIAKEMIKISPYYCGARLCCFELVQLKSKYEKFKRTGVRNGDLAHFLDEAREAFEDSVNLERTFTIKVSNLSHNVEKSDLQDLFGNFGKIAHIHDIQCLPGKSKRFFAFIKFHKAEDATRAIQVVNGHEYDKLILEVEWAQPSQINEVLE